MEKTAIHPCTYAKVYIPIFTDILNKEKAKTALDIFGGIGGLAKVKNYGFNGKVIINEIEPKWAKIAKKVADKVICGDARKLPLQTKSIDAIITSPTYGNDMGRTAPSRNRTYTVCNDNNPLKEGNTGKLIWGDTYKSIHIDAYKEAFRVLTTKGVLVLNVKNHIRKGKEQKVTQWHLTTLKNIGFNIVKTIKIKTKGIPFGGLNIPKVPFEYIIVLKKNSLTKAN
jgi:hypothetical protein